MNNKTLHINKPSKKLLFFIKSLKENKEKTKKELILKKELYFSK
jgi:hypothetical protein